MDADFLNGIYTKLNNNEAVIVQFDSFADIKEFVAFAQEDILLDFKRQVDTSGLFNARWTKGSFGSAALYQLLKETPNEVKFSSFEDVARFVKEFNEMCDSGRMAEFDDSIVPHEESVEEEPKSAPIHNEGFPTNPKAEGILDTVNDSIYAVQCILAAIVAIGGLIAGVVLIEEEGGVGAIPLVGGILLGAILFILARIIWAMGKVVINISRNLFSINEMLKKLAPKENDSEQQ